MNPISKFIPILLITIFLIMGGVAGATNIKHLKQTDTSISGEEWDVNI